MESKIHKEDNKKLNRKIGKAQAETELWKKYYLDKYRINPELLSETYLNKITELEDMKEKYDNLNTWYIVVNPNPKLMEDPNEFKEFIEKCIEARMKKWIHTCKLWFEFRDNSKCTIHANFAITKSKYAPSRVKAEFWNSFKRWCFRSPDTENNIIKIQRVRESEYLNICAYQYNPKKWVKDQMMLKIHKLDNEYMWCSKS